MSRATRRRPVSRLPPEQRISDILSAARAVFSDKGFDAALISDIAARAGVVEGSVYRFFSTKRELLVRVVEEWFEDLIQEGAEDIAAVHGAGNRIRAIVYRHLVSIRRDPALARLMFLEIRPSADYRGSRLFELNRAYSQRLADVVKAGIAAGELRPDVAPGLVRDMVFGCTEHRTWAFLRREGDFDPVQTAEAITGLVLGGLSTAGETAGAEQEAIVRRLDDIAGRMEAAMPIELSRRARPSSRRSGSVRT